MSDSWIDGIKCDYGQYTLQKRANIGGILIIRGWTYIGGRELSPSAPECIE